MLDLSTKAVKKRLGLSFAAGVGSQLVTVVHQLVSVPVFLWAWGKEGYGVWLVAYSLGAYLSTLADFGFANATASEVGMRRAAGNLDGTLAVFQSSLVFLLISGTLAMAIGVAAAWGLPLGDWLGLADKWWYAFSVVLSLFVCGLPLAMFSVLCCAAFRGEGKMAQGVFYYYVLGRLLETLAMFAAALSGGGLIAAAAAGLGTKVVTAAAIGVLARKQVSWVRFGFGSASRSELRGLLRPAAAHMGNPVSSLLSIAGMNVLVSNLLGPAAVTVVSVMRTLGNLAFQAFNMIAAAAWPELSALMGGNQHELAQRVLLRLGRLCLWLSLIVCGGLLLVGSPVLRIWTGGQVEMVWGLFAMQLLAILMSCMWRIPSVTLLATNRNGRLAVLQMVAVVLSLAVTAVLLPYMGVQAVGVGLVFTEGFVLFGIIGQAVGVAGLKVNYYVRQVAIPPSPGEAWGLVCRRRMAT